MRNAARNTLQLIIFMLLLHPMPVRAIPAISCHCFTDRSYDAARPAAADPYFLASIQNSFIAIVFNTDKNNIVIKKQQGTSSMDRLLGCLQSGCIPGYPAPCQAETGILERCSDDAADQHEGPGSPLLKCPECKVIISSSGRNGGR